MNVLILRVFLFISNQFNLNLIFGYALTDTPEKIVDDLKGIIELSISDYQQ